MATGGKGASEWIDVETPPGWTWSLPFIIEQKGTTFRPNTSWTVSSMVTQTGGDRYVGKGGDNGNDGLTYATRWLTVSKAIADAPANGRVYISAGKYGWSDGGPNNTAWGKNLSLIASEAGVYFDATANPGSWSLTSGKTYTYQGGILFDPLYVFDYGTLAADGSPTSYTRQASVDDVEANAGSFYYASNVVYVRPLEAGSPDADVRVQYSGSGLVNFTADNRKVYLQGITACCLKSYAAKSSSGGSLVAMEDCKIFYPNNGVAINLAGVDGIFRDCIYARNNYAADLLYASGCNVIEIDCQGYNTGIAPDTSYNATTNHTAGKNVIIGGEYYDCRGPNVGFINDGECWLLGVNSHDSVGVSEFNANYQLNEAIAYLDTCSGSDSTYDFNIAADVYVRDFDGAASKTGTGTVQSY